ncbi:MAG: phosphate butyryltransferase [Planctomycetota bacterium]
MMNNFDELLATVKEQPLRKVAVAVAQDTSVLRAVRDAREQDIAEAVLVGNKGEILAAARQEGVAVDEKAVVDEPNEIKAALRAVELVSTGAADIVMKGHIHTDDFLRAVLDKERGLRAGVLMSHVFVVEWKETGKLIFITDGAMNIAPDLEQKAEIVLNALYLAKIFGIHKPRVGMLAAVELLNPKMQATLDATAIAKMGDRRQFSPECVIDGPFGLDNAVSEIAAKHKKISGPVAGKADILVVPDIEAGNILVKSLVYFAHCRLAGVLVGARAPVVLTSRADSAESKMMSIATAVLMINVERALQLKIGKVHY